MRFVLLGLVLLLSAVVFTTPSRAHPHAWIVMNATLQFNNKGLIEGVALQWRFDKQYSKDSIVGLDVNKDGYFAPEELQILATENLNALKEYRYFVYATADGKKIKYNKAKDYSQYLSNEVLTMSFTIPFDTPVDPLKSKIVMKTYDPTFFIAMDFQKHNPVSAMGKMPKNCNIELKPIPSDTDVSQAKNLLATKTKDWQPKPQEEFGALFAQPVIVACK